MTPKDEAHGDINYSKVDEVHAATTAKDNKSGVKRGLAFWAPHT